MTLKPWWLRWVSLSFHPIGSCALWWCQAESGQVHIYREWFAARASAEAVGIEIARAAEPDQAQVIAWTEPQWFEPGHHKSIAEQISEGIERELGPSTAFLWMSTYAESGLPDASERVAALERRKAALQDIRVTLRPVVDDEAAGWEHLRELLRTEPHKSESPLEFSGDVVRDLLQQPDGEKLYRDYMMAVARPAPVLPKLLVHAPCKGAIQALSSLRRQPAKPEEALWSVEDAAGRAILYGALAHRAGQNREPLEAYRARRMEEASKKTDDQGRLFMIGEKAGWDWAKANKQQRSYKFRVMPRRNLFV